jgi:hypothetical protein
MLGDVAEWQKAGEERYPERALYQQSGDLRDKRADPTAHRLMLASSEHVGIVFG